jgi:hypothetical protein
MSSPRGFAAAHSAPYLRSHDWLFALQNPGV